MVISLAVKEARIAGSRLQIFVGFAGFTGCLSENLVLEIYWSSCR